MEFNIKANIDTETILSSVAADVVTELFKRMQAVENILVLMIQQINTKRQRGQRAAGEEYSWWLRASGRLGDNKGSGEGEKGKR